MFIFLLFWILILRKKKQMYKEYTYTELIFKMDNTELVDSITMKTLYTNVNNEEN